MQNKWKNRQKAFESLLWRLSRRILTLEKICSHFSWIRLIVFLFFAVLVACSVFLIGETVAWFVFGFGFVVFNVIAFFHRKIDRSLKWHRIWHDLKSSYLARIRLDWNQIPQTAGLSIEPDHPFGSDLDIVGEKSLHQLLDVSVSYEGSRRLAEWLLKSVPDLNRMRRRRKIVSELMGMSHFRDRLLFSFRLLTREKLNGKKLIRWLDQKMFSFRLEWRLFVALGLAGVNVAFFVLNKLNVIPPWWIFSLMVYGIFFMLNNAVFAPLFESVDSMDEEVGKFKIILKFLEIYRYGRNRHLRALCKPFIDPKHPPSKELRKVKQLTVAAGLRMNTVMTFLLNLAFPWDFFVAYRIKKCRDRLSEKLPIWLDIWYELEALLSLSTFAYLYPDYTFPEIDVQKGPYPFFEARGMGHPLIPYDQKVVNDFSVNQTGEIVIVTGSNMSGKSTFLRTVGINLCLAFAGGPVNASCLRTIPFRLFTCIRVSDSVTEGFSYFYAEVKRLKLLLENLERQHEYPLLFLIDEIFRGTNNKERLIGSRSYVRKTTGFSGIGIIATHDLELVNLAKESDSIRNVHFREEVKNGGMVFDYLLHPGPCPTTNALKIMKIEGLPVDD